MAEIILKLADAKAERLVAAIEHLESREHLDETLEGYRKRIADAFLKHCPDRAYTASPLDVDTLLANLEAKLAALTPHTRRAGDPKEGA